ncbi:MAG: GAF domain-containing protein [Anaerolineae bacterium]|nr:GAF domain-containing protein [Anaerolineae bacterium]
MTEVSQDRTRLHVEPASERVAAEIEADVQNWRRRILNILLVIASGAALLVAGNSILQAAREPQRASQPVLALAISAFIVSLALLRQLDSRLRAWGLFFLGYMIAATFMVNAGLVGSGMVLLLALPALGVIVLGIRPGLVMALLSVTVYGAVAVAVAAGWMQGAGIAGAASLELSQWLGQGLLFGLLLIMLIVVQTLFAKAQREALQAARESAEELGTARDQLQFRSEELDRYARLLEVSTRITHEVTGLLEPEALLARAAELIAEQLGLEGAEIYLTDEHGDEPVLVAAATARRVPVSTGQVIPAAVVQAARLPLRDGSLLPDGRDFAGELALPLEAGGQVAGVLYLRSSKPLVSDRDELVVLQAVADQIAIALENARLYADAQSSLREIDALYRHYATESWQRFLAEHPKPAQRWGSGEMGEEWWQPLFEEARASGSPVTGVQAETGHHLLAFPIRLRGATIGVLGFHRPEASGPWQPADMAAVEAVVARLALVSDNLRLLDETQRRAARERLTSQATGRMRASLDVETVLSTAVGEIAGVLGLVALDLRLVDTDGSENEGSGGSPDSMPSRGME